jgi:hypothetical protein
MLITFRPYAKLQPLKPLAEYDQKVVRMRQRGFIYPYEIIKMLTPALEHTRAEFPAGDFVEHDLDSKAASGESIVPMVKTKPTSLSVSSATLPPNIPRA